MSEITKSCLNCEDRDFCIEKKACPSDRLAYWRADYPTLNQQLIEARKELEICNKALEYLDELSKTRIGFCPMDLAYEENWSHPEGRCCDCDQKDNYAECWKLKALSRAKEASK